MKIYDVAVIGCGSVGSAVGYYASLSGASVIEFDRDLPPHQHGTHHGETRIIRHAYAEGEKYVPLLLKAQTLWNELAQLTNLPIFSQCGMVNIAPKHSVFLKNVLKSAQTYNLETVFYTAQELKKRWQAWQFDEDYAAVFEPQAGYLYSENIVKTYIEQAKKHHVEQVFNCEVQRIEQIESGVKITTQNQTYYAKQVVVCAGTWVKQLLPTLPIQPVRKVFEWFEVKNSILQEKNGFPAFAIQLKDHSTYYGFPANQKTIKIGRHDGGEPMQTSEEQFAYSQSDAQAVTPLLKQHLLGVGQCHYGASCSYDMSPDEDFIIDWIGKNIQVVTGLSGHGFKFVSVLGWLLAERALGKEVEFDLSSFSLDRFNQQGDGSPC